MNASKLRPSMSASLRNDSSIGSVSKSLKSIENETLTPQALKKLAKTQKKENKEIC